PDACLVDGTLVTLLMPASHYDNNDAVLSWMIMRFLAAYLQWSGSSDNYRRNFSQRQYFLGGTAVNGFFRHTKHHRGGFILSDSARTCICASLSSRSAKDAVNFSGICCTMTIPGHTRGKATRTASSA